MTTSTDKYWSTFHEHPFPWSQVVSLYWRRYPNPSSGHVFSEDFAEVKVREDGLLYTKRLLIKTNKPPSWSSHFFSAKDVPVIEEAVVDPVARTMTTYTRNIGLRYFMGTTERVTYKPVGEKTEVLKEVWINSGVYGFRSAIKKFGVDRFKRNCVAASEGFEHVLRKKLDPCENRTKFKNSSSANGNEQGLT